MNVLASRFTRVAALATAIASPSYANLVVNGSFEDGIGSPANGSAISVGNGSTVITGWLVTSNGSGNIEWEGQGSSSLTTPVGSRLLDLIGNPDYAARATISQSIATAIGSTYRLSFIVGVDNDVRSAARWGSR